MISRSDATFALPPAAYSGWEICTCVSIENFIGFRRKHYECDKIKDIETMRTTLLPILIVHFCVTCKFHMWKFRNFIPSNPRMRTENDDSACA